MTSLRLYIINAFVRPQRQSLGTGNPAAVILLTEKEDRALSDTTRQSLARELNVSDTAFITRLPANLYKLRWFTPATEVWLCGHATLAGMQALLEAGWATEGDEIAFDTVVSGTLLGRVPGEAGDEKPPLEIRLPLLSRRPDLSGKEQGEMRDMLGVGAEESFGRMFRSQYDLVVEVGSATGVQEARPDLESIKKMTNRGVILAAGDGPRGFVCRFFAPGAGIDEDSVTGSAACALAEVFLEEGEEGVMRQLSPRGGLVRVKRFGGEVWLSGWARTVVQGEVKLNLDP